APVKFTAYLEEYYIKDSVLPRWSATYWKDQHVFMLGDTNMNLEFYHHFLKSNLWKGQLNRRMDKGICTLVEVAITHYIA
ncbi:hypothetical protein BDV98DRAFT_514670, partial [Pterulicium gracile]